MRLTLIGAIVGTAIAGLAWTAPSAGTPPSDAAHASAPAPAAQATASASSLYPRHRPTTVEHYVDLNSASRKELMMLPGIGKAEADRIVANRPYLVKTDLVSKNVLTVGPFLSIKHLVVAMPKSVTQAKH